MKEKQQLAFLIVHFLFSCIISFIESSLVTAFIWADFNGFGGVTMEFTKSGTISISAILTMLPLLLMAVLSIRLFKLHKCKSDIKWYVDTILCCALGVGIGILIFQLPLLQNLRETVDTWLIRLIRSSGWISYPIG